MGAPPPFNSPIWPVEKTDGYWKKTVDCQKLSHVVTQFGAAVLDVVCLIDQINTSPGTRYLVCSYWWRKCVASWGALNIVLAPHGFSGG